MKHQISQTWTWCPCRCRSPFSRAHPVSGYVLGEPSHTVHGTGILTFALTPRSTTPMTMPVPVVVLRRSQGQSQTALRTDAPPTSPAPHHLRRHRSDQRPASRRGGGGHGERTDEDEGHRPGRRRSTDTSCDWDGLPHTARPRKGVGLGTGVWDWGSPQSRVGTLECLVRMCGP